MNTKAIGGLGVVALLALGACQTNTAWEGDGQRVSIQGDSLTYQADNDSTVLDNGDEFRYLRDQFVEAGYSVSMTGYVGGNYEDATGWVQDIPDPGADVLMLALGTNDLHVDEDGAPFTVDEVTDNLLSILDGGHADCYVVVTMYTGVEAWGLDVDGPQFNANVKDIASVRENVHVADWNATVQPGYNQPDDPHHTSEGRAAYRDFLVESAGLCT